MTLGSAQRLLHLFDYFSLPLPYERFREFFDLFLGGPDFDRGGAHGSDEPLLDLRREFEQSNELGKFDSLTREFAAHLDELRRTFWLDQEFLVKLISFLERLVDLADRFERVIVVFLDLLFCDAFLFAEGHDFTDREFPFCQFVADLEQFGDGDRGTRDGLLRANFPALDAFGNRYFAFTRQQRNDAHLPQIKSHRIVGFVERSRT